MKPPLFAMNDVLKVEVVATQAQSKIKVTQVMDLYVQSIHIHKSEEDPVYAYGMSPYSCDDQEIAPHYIQPEYALVALNKKGWFK